MDKLNYECLEHILRFTDSGPKEWLVLSQVCRMWREVISRFWKRINRIEIAPNKFDRKRPYLSTKRVIAIIERAGYYVNEITITARKINNIRLGEYVYNLNGLDMDAFLESFELHCNGRILKANFYPEDPVCGAVMRCSSNLKKITLTLDRQCGWDFFAEFAEENSVEELEFIVRHEFYPPSNVRKF